MSLNRAETKKSRPKCLVLLDLEGFF
ncbi:hypothetical protein I306_00824 [Cryptococcus gattii EJB2]|uniref:Uncharacterized protein n=1 Tax=Cryptococcus gattii EJB2 TaxID=1296103 RepID=A0ABR5C2E1_9TREE|nr:hypothetical protein I306_00824 [Cryptococcus gattii EJB2]